MFKWTYQESFSFFILNDAGKQVPFDQWKALQGLYLSEIAILTELADNGFCEVKDTACVVEPDVLLLQSEIDKRILGLPSNYPYDLYIQSDGQLNQNFFKFRYGFYDFVPNGNRLLVHRTGPLVTWEDRVYLLSYEQYRLCEALDEFNCLPENAKSASDNFCKFQSIKNIAKKAGVQFDNYLTNEDVLVPERIKIDIRRNNGIFELIPEVGMTSTDPASGQETFITQKGFSKSFNLRPLSKVYPTNDGGKRTRVVFEDKQSILSTLKSKSKLSSEEELCDLVENAERYLNDDLIDLEYFSQRVKEIGAYKPKFYPFVCPYKSEWIPGIAVRDKIDGEKRIYFRTPQELAEFEKEKKYAESSGESSIEWDGTTIPLDMAEVCIENGKKQFQNQKEPIQKQPQEGAGQVLIIHENAELLEYDELDNVAAKIEHTFASIENLNHGICLKDHQVEGIAWLQTLHNTRFRGCLLADDMGLGKTLQLLYFIEWHSQAVNQNKPYLIVAPVSLLENWENEYKKFFNPTNLSITSLYGGGTLSKEFNREDVEMLQKKHIILTNYETLRIYQLNLAAVDYAVVALDEAQKIKTPGTLVTNVCKALKADFKIAMTGTPVENTLVDLWCILDFSIPGLLGNAKEFAKSYQNRLKDETTDIRVLGEELRNRIGVFLKRRMKHDVAKDLPKKFDNDRSRLQRVMPPIQSERYKAQIEVAKREDLVGVDRRNQILKSIWAIRDISDHPYLLDHQITKFATDELIASSAKLQVTVGLMEEIRAKNEKVILFAERKDTQKLLQKVIFDLFGIFPSIVNGDTPTTKSEGSVKISRQQTVDRFQLERGFNAIVMSPLAAGVGLNVTGANHVIHYTRHWNPAKEEQATDRAYRIGQQKDVYVYYPMAVFPEEMVGEGGVKLKSFDEILDDLLTRKKNLATSTLFPTEQAEVRPDELLGDLFGFNPESNLQPLSLSEADKLNPNLFEALVAAIYYKMEFEVYITPFSKDQGVDVVALSSTENLIFQVKQSKSTIGNTAIQELYTAKNYYERKFGSIFSMCVITNNFFSDGAMALANSNGVKLFNRSDLEYLMLNYPISLKDINRIESERLERI